MSKKVLAFTKAWCKIRERSKKLKNKPTQNPLWKKLAPSPQGVFLRTIMTKMTTHKRFIPVSVSPESQRDSEKNKAMMYPDSPTAVPGGAVASQPQCIIQTGPSPGNVLPRDNQAQFARLMGEIVKSTV